MNVAARCEATRCEQRIDAENLNAKKLTVTSRAVGAVAGSTRAVREAFWNCRMAQSCALSFRGSSLHVAFGNHEGGLSAVSAMLCNTGLLVLAEATSPGCVCEFGVILDGLMAWSPYGRAALPPPVCRAKRPCKK